MIRKLLIYLMAGLCFSCMSQSGAVNNSTGSEDYQLILTKYIQGNYSEVVALLNQVKPEKGNDLAGISYLYGL